MLEKLTALLAAFNDGANKGFWRFQWRDRLGRWAEMGRGVLGKLRLKDGTIVSVRGVFVGGTENPGFGRVLVEGQSDKGIPDGIYYFASGNGETFEGLIPEEDLIRQGLLPEGGASKKDIFGNAVGERLDKDIQDLDTIRREDITDEDRKLATETPDERQKAIIEEERAKSPVAQLPAGAESDPDQLAKALEDAGVTPKTQTQDAPPPPGGEKFLPAPPPVPPTEDGNKFLPMPETPPAGEPSKAETPPSPKLQRATDGWLRGAREEGEPIFWMSYNRSTGNHTLNEGHIIDGYVYKGKYNQFTDQGLEGVGSVDDLIATRKNKNSGLVDIYRGNIPAIEDENGKFRKAEASDIFKIEREQNAAKAAQMPTPPAEPSKAEIPPTPGALDNLDLYTQRVVSDLIETANGQEPKDINKTLKKLNNLLSKPDSNKAGTNAAIEALSDIVKSKGGTPFDPASVKPSKPSTGIIKRGKKNDYIPGDMVAVFDNLPGDPVAPEFVSVGEVLGVSKDEFGQTKFDVRLPDGDWKIDPEDMQPLDSAIEDIPSLAEKSSAPGGDDSFDDLDFFDEEPVTPPVTPEVKPRPKKEPKAKVEPTEPKSEPIIPEKPSGKPSDVPSVTADEIREPAAGDTPEDLVPADDMPLNEAIEYVSKMSMEELDALAKPEDYLEDTKGILPSQEQTRALNAITRADADVVIDALAGAGKTWTLVAAANALSRLRPDARILVLAFGNKNAADARRRIPKQNATAMTTHALAIKSLTKSQRDAMDSKKRWMVASSEEDIALALGFDDTPLPQGNLSAADAAHVIGKAVTYFCNSGDTEIGEKHVLRALGEIDGFEAEGFKTPEKLINWAKAYWADVSSDRKVEWDDKNKKASGPKRVRLTHDHYLKMWSLSEPDLSNIMINGKPVTHVFFDEAQDTNPTVASVMKSNKGKVQQTFVGDPNQAIFGFRGAENFLDEAKGDTDAIVDLTRTRRFGDGMTAPGNGYLNLLGARRRVKGVGSGGEVVSKEDIPLGPNTALLVRTNYAGLDSIMARQEEGQTVGCLSVFYEELEKAIYHLKWLGEPFDKRTKGPQTPDGRPAYSDDFVGISNFKQLMKRAERDKKSKAARWLDLYYEKGEGSTEKFERVLETLVIDRSDMGNADGSVQSDPGTESIMWITKTGKELAYSVDGMGVVKFTDNGSGAMFEKVSGQEVYKHLKDAGFKFNKFDKSWGAQYADDTERQEFLDRFANLIPDRLSSDDRVPDIIVSTAHRAKGLEWDNVIIGPDFPEPKVDPATGTVQFPSQEEMRLAYVALTRGKQKIAVESLGWGREYEGRDGLEKANVDLKRKPGYGTEAWDYHDAQMAEAKDEKLDEGSSAPLSGASYKDDFFDEEELDSMDSGSEGSASAPKGDFTDSWVQQEIRDNKFTKSEGGVTWELTKNADGSVTLRSRNDSSIPTKKYDSMADLQKDFKNQVAAGNKSSREELKRITKPFDKNGKIAKMIDSGASATDINDALNKTDDWEDAIDNNKVNISSLGRALNRVGATIPARKRKPVAKKKPAAPGQPSTPIQPPAKFTPATGAVVPAVFIEAQKVGRDDKGGSVPRTGLNSAQLEDFLKQATDAKTESIIKNALRLNGKATVKPDGSIVWFRETKKETVGPGAGKTLTTELSFKEGKDSSFTVMLKVTDTKTGQSQEFYHYSKHHSLGSIIGDPTGQSAGVERLLDQYFDRDLKSNPHPDPQDERLYGGVLGAIKKLRAGRFDRILADKGSDDSSFKLRTPEEHAAFILNGRNRRFNKSLQNWWTQGRKERESLFDAVENNDFSSVFNILNRYLTGLPDTPAARKIAMDYITAAVKRKFPRLDTRQMTDLMGQVDAYISGSLPTTGLVASPHLDKNNNVVSAGNKVRWRNNNNQFVVGEVRFRIQRDTPNEGKNSYGDYVIVDFPTGKGEETFGVRLNTKNMEVVDQGTPTTPYQEWVEKDEAKLARYEEAGWGFNPETGEFFDKLSGRVVDKLDGTFDGPTSSNAPAPTKAAKDIAAGDELFDANGISLGKVKSARQATSKSTGKLMVGVEFEDGTKKVFEATDNVNTGPSQSPPPSAPASKPLGARAVRAAALGVGGPKGKKISKNKADPTNKDTSVPIQGRTDVVATRPTDEANEILAEAKALGGELRVEADALANEKMRERGYDVPDGTSYLDLPAVAQKDADIAQRDLDAKNADVDKFARERSKTAARNIDKVNATIAEMKAEGLTDSKGAPDKKKVAKLLIEAGYRPLGYKLEHTPKDEGGLLAVAAYRILKGQDSTGEAKLKDLTAAHDSSLRANNAAQDRLQKVSSDASIASSESVLEVLKNEGVEFDSVSYKDFGDSIVSDDAGIPFRPEDEFLSARALQEAFDYMPTSWIKNLAAHLKSTGKVLRVKAGVRRGHFKQIPGGYELHLSSGPKRADQTKVTDTAIHELTHFVQKVDENVRALEHAWLFNRAVLDQGTENERMVQFSSLPGYKKSERAFAVPGLSNPYQAKTYGRQNAKVPLNPNDSASEVMTMAMQDLFTQSGVTSIGRGVTVVSRDPKDRRKKKTTRGAFYDPQTGTWFKDKEMTKPIPDVVQSWGRDVAAGIDTESRDFAIGTLLVLNDWNAATGTGPGNAVQPKKPGKKK